MDKELRLDKFLADMGKGTRSALKEAVRKGRVRVNGEVIKKADIKVRIPGDTVTLDGEEVAYAVMEYYMLNKPQGVVSATEDKKYPTVLDLIADKKRKDLFPVGRLDLDTEGLLLITNDGDLAHRLLSPKKHVDKVYYARCRGTVCQGDPSSRRAFMPSGRADGPVLRPYTGRVRDPPADPGGEIPSGKADDGGRRLSGVFFKAPVHGAAGPG